VPQAQAKAKMEGVSFRVTVADGEVFPVTMDYRVGRINAEIKEGKVVSYNVEGQDDEPDVETERYNQESWKTMIADSCTSFFDGCNNCNRMEGGSMAACTEKFCAAYQKPECLEERTTNADESTAPGRGKRVTYQCDDNKEFLVSHDEYVSGDAIVKLQADQIMFSDSQTRTASIMNRTVAASGEKYQSENGLVFWSKGSSATIIQGEENLYENCEEV
jgi:membrane-bound inhibitor of C-type lysozyme